MKILPRLLIIGLVLLGGCQEKPEEPFIGQWIGAYMELDPDVAIPYLNNLEFDRNGQYRAHTWGDEEMQTTDWSIAGDSIRIDTFSFPLSSFRFENDQMIWGEYYPRHFFHAQATQLSLDKAEMEATIAGKTYENEAEKVYFAADGKLWWWPKTAEEAYQYRWRIEEWNGQFYLLRFGEADQMPRYHFTEQIIGMDHGEFITYGWKKNRLGKHTYALTESNANDWPMAKFQRCFPFMYRNYPRDRYYYQGTIYPGGQYVLRQKLQAFYPEDVDADSAANGLIRIGFIVNCKGEAGEFDLLTLDMNYQPSSFEPKLENALLNFCKSLQDWIPGDRNGSPIDTYRYLNFKIRNGKVVEIFP